MDLPNFFADANSSFNNAEFVIFGVPYNKTSSFRYGSDQAPFEIRKNSWNYETFNLRNGVDFKNIKVHDFGDINIIDDKTSNMIDKVREFSKKILDNNKFPIAIGGEHSITPGIIKAYPKEIAVLSLDAHMDFRNTYENDKYNHACVNRRIADHVNINNIALIGVRSAEKEEYKIAKNNNLYWISSYNIFNEGIEKTLSKLKKYINKKNVYLSLDIDVIDPAYAPGTSTPEPFGLKPYDVLRCIEELSEKLVGFDIVEVCPPYDHGETALLAAKIIKSLIEEVWLTNHRE